MKSRTLSYQEILKRLRTEFPVSFTVPDPFTGEPMTCAREDMIRLLVPDRQNLSLDLTLVSALYAEMARFRRAAEVEAARAESRYRAWKAGKAKELEKKMPPKKTASGKKAAKQGPTQAEIEQYYRGSKNYEEMSVAGPRLHAIAGLFGDLMWGFKLKAEIMQDESRTVGGYEATERAASYEKEESRMVDYATIRAEAKRIAESDDSDAALNEMLNDANEVSATKKPTSL